MNPHDEPLSAEERELAQRLARLGPHGEPSSALDARILAAAHDAVAGTRARERRKARRHWPVGMGVAASLVLAVGIAWQLRPTPPDQVELSEAPVAADAEAAGVVAEPKQESADLGSAADAAVEQRATPPMQAKPRDDAAAAAPATATTRASAPGVPEEPAIVLDDLSPAASSAAPAPMPASPPPPAPPAPLPLPPATATDSAAGSLAGSREIREQSAASNAARPAARRDESKSAAAEAEAAPELDRVQVTGSRLRKAEADDFVEEPPADQPLDDQPPASADSIVVQQAWMQRIRDLIAEGKLEDARASLHEFKRRYPGVVLPDDLRRFGATSTP